MALILPFTAAGSGEGLSTVRRVLAAHGIIAVPTETHYGLAVSPMDDEALSRLFAVKGRPSGKPILLLIGNRSQLTPLVASIPSAAALLMECCWPGPLTLVFPAAASLPPMLTGGTGTIGIRLPPVPDLCALLGFIGPLTGTSANRSAEPPLDRAEDVQRLLGDAIDLILDGGHTPGGLSSTVVDVCGQPRLLRAGVLPTEEIRAALARQGIELSS